MLEAFGLALLLGYLAFALMACAMARHRDDIAGCELPEPTAAAGQSLRLAAGVLLLAALCAAISLAGPAFGALLWAMDISLAAMLVAFTLTWRPGWLAPLLRWVMRRSG
ncbi:DUF3325 family protein [Bordetella genomosp. 13]|uniref:DUF3325 domain-containing protein n=1 Tax=Bordetella genomosp. 13 TaxID=463040 RepID=A0A1W6ZAZ0_9BORD|nr:DUF3325 family protein [Bordetella genomosp. 13]ARP94004.1 hypothetical protein CAL15_06185 [Bordetella genomosp. 13]